VPDEQTTSDEWLELYRHLLGRLSERQLTTVRAEIELAAAAPIFEEGTPEEDLQISRIVRGEVGKATMRLRNPAEMFAAALELLRARLTEIPAIVEAVGRHLERPVEQIEFRLDTPTPSEPILLTQLSASTRDVVAVSEILMRLGVRAERIKPS
jgi:hypothetical protein